MNLVEDQSAQWTGGEEPKTVKKKDRVWSPAEFVIPVFTVALYAAWAGMNFQQGKRDIALWQLFALVWMIMFFTVCYLADKWRNRAFKHQDEAYELAMVIKTRGLR